MRNSKETVIPTVLRRPTAEVPGFRHPCELCEALGKNLVMFSSARAHGKYASCDAGLPGE